MSLLLVWLNQFVTNLFVLVTAGQKLLLCIYVNSPYAVVHEQQKAKPEKENTLLNETDT